MGIAFGGLPNCSQNDSITRAQGLFGQATVDLSLISPSLDGFNFTAGYRHSWDYLKRKNRSTNRTTGACALANAGPNCFVSQSGSWTAPNWSFQLDYRFDSDKMVYVTVSRAYSRGTLNNPDLPAALRLVDPQFNTNYEGGVKADWNVGSSQLRTNLSVFYNHFADIQEIATGSYVDQQGNQRITGVTLNAAKARIVGFETSIQIVLSDQFEISGGYVFADAKYLNFDSLDPSTGLPVSLADRRFEYHAKHRGNVTLRYNVPLDQSVGEISAQATASITSHQTGLDDGSPIAPWSRSKLDLRADWASIYGYPVDFSISATNVTNHRYSIIGFNLYQTLGIITTQYAEPRMISGTLRYRF